MSDQVHPLAYTTLTHMGLHFPHKLQDPSNLICKE